MNRTIAAHKAVATMNKNKATQWRGVASHLQDENAALRRQLAAYKANSTRRATQAGQ